MNRTDAEKLADDIFDMIDRNHPRGLIKSELVDLLAKCEPAVQETLPFPPKPALCEADLQQQAALQEQMRKLHQDVVRYGNGFMEVSDATATWIPLEKVSKDIIDKMTTLNPVKETKIEYEDLPWALGLPAEAGPDEETKIEADKKALAGLGYYFPDVCGND